MAERPCLAPKRLSLRPPLRPRPLQVGKGADVERQSQSAAAPPVEDILDELAASRANGATKLADDDATTPTTPESPHAADPPPIGGASMPGAMP